MIATLVLAVGVVLAVVVLVRLLDLVITQALVQPATGTVYNADYNAGAAITAGMALYKKSDTKLYGAQNDVDDEQATFFGVAMHGADIGQPVKAAQGGPVTIGAALVAGEIYCVSSNAGKICSSDDLAAGQRLTIIGYATSATVLYIYPRTTNVVHG